MMRRADMVIFLAPARYRECVTPVCFGKFKKTYSDKLLRADELKELLLNKRNLMKCSHNTYKMTRLFN